MTGLTEIVLSGSVEDIMDFAFMGCTRLEHVTLSNRLRRIEDGVFCNCSSLKDITIPGSLRSIGLGIFQGCKSLSIRFEEGIEQIHTDIALVDETWSAVRGTDIFDTIYVPDSAAFQGSLVNMFKTVYFESQASYTRFLWNYNAQYEGIKKASLRAQYKRLQSLIGSPFEWTDSLPPSYYRLKKRHVRKTLFLLKCSAMLKEK